jgi:predicted N-acetyltransferase YhbS
MFQIGDESPAEAGDRERLLDRAMDAGWRRKPSAGLRAGNWPAPGLSLVARKSGRLIGTVRLWPVSVGARGTGALLLGPLAVDPNEQGDGVGSALMHAILARASALGHHGIVLVGNPLYYHRFGFLADAAGRIRIPGQHDQHRVLGRELVPGSLAQAEGVLRAATVTARAAPRTRRPVGPTQADSRAHRLAA